MSETSKQIWKHPPEGLIRAHLGRIRHDRDRGYTIVPIVSICEDEDGARIRKTKKMYLTAKGVKNVRLRRVLQPE